MYCYRIIYLFENGPHHTVSQSAAGVALGLLHRPCWPSLSVITSLLVQRSLLAPLLQYRYREEGQWSTVELTTRLCVCLLWAPSDRVPSLQRWGLRLGLWGHGARQRHPARSRKRSGPRGWWWCADAHELGSSSSDLARRRSLIRTAGREQHLLGPVHSKQKLLNWQQSLEWRVNQKVGDGGRQRKGEERERECGRRYRLVGFQFLHF